jgi:hypothetical protein
MFYGSNSIETIVIPSNVTYIHPSAFDFRYWSNGTIYGYIGSAAETYALSNRIRFVPLDEKFDNCPACEEYSCVCRSSGDVLVPGVTFSFRSGDRPADAATLPGAYIDLAAETFTIPPGYSIQGYSINGGRTWIAGNLTQDAFVNLLNRDLDLWLCYRDFNANSRKPQGSDAAHNIIAFPRIGKRAPRPALVINYEIGANNGESGDFLLIRRNSTETIQDIKNTIEIGRADSATGRTVDSRHFGKFYDGATNGIPLPPMMDGKASRAVYFIRTAPKDNGDNTFTAAGKVRKITVRGPARPTNRRINYKTEILRLSRGDTYAIGSGSWSDALTQRLDLDVLEHITNGNVIRIKRVATASRPATTIQTIQPISRAILTSVANATNGNGKLELAGIYEVFNPTTQKWGRVPSHATTGTHTFDIRIKSTAKVSNLGATGSAASLPGTLTITYGQLTDSSGKTRNGVTGAVINP